jgi:hypothetical protein
MQSAHLHLLTTGMIRRLHSFAEPPESLAIFNTPKTVNTAHLPVQSVEPLTRVVDRQGPGNLRAKVTDGGDGRVSGDQVAKLISA